MKIKQFIISMLLMAVLVCGSITYGYAATNKSNFDVQTITLNQNFDNISYFREGIATIKIGDYMGAINNDGKTIIPAEYYHIFDCNGGVMAVMKKGRGTAGYIDRQGKIVLPLKYNFTSSFHDGIASVTVKQGSYQIIDRNFKVISKKYTQGYYSDGLIRYRENPRNEAVGFIDGAGNIVIKPSKGLEFVRNFHNGMAEIDGTGYVDKTGKIILFPEYMWTSGGFNDGLAVAFDQPKKIIGTPQLGGYMNTAGEMAIPKIYRLTEPFKSGYAIVGKPGEDGRVKYGVINTKGETVIPFEYDGNAANQITDNGYFLLEKDKRVGFVDINNNSLTGFIYEDAEPFKDGLAAVKINGKWGYINAEGETVIPTIYDDFDIWSLVDNHSEFDDEYELDYQCTVHSFHNGAVFMKKDGKWVILKQVPKTPPSSWAANEVNQAISNGFVPKDLQSLYTAKITREEFCRIVASMIREKYGSVVQGASGQTSFSDTTKEDVLLANSLGIVSGTGGGKFSPNNYITRQEAATMLYRTAKAIDGEQKIENDISYADSTSIASWATEPIAYVSTVQNNIMNGTGDNCFNPKGYYTREQAYVTINRLYNNLTK